MRILERSAGIIPIYLAPEGPLVLVVKQHQGHWSIPKGHIEDGETDIDAALRELKEETGVTDIKVDQKAKISHYYDFERNGEKIEKEVIYFPGIAKSRQVNIQEHEILDFAWVRVSQLKDKFISNPSRQKLINKIDDYIGSL